MSFLTDKMKKDSIGARGEPFDIEIEKRLITMFLDALGDENPTWQGDKPEQNGRMLAPPGLFHTLMFIDNRPELTFELPLTNRFDGGGKWDYFAEVRSGDIITVDTTISDIYEKEGRSGPMVFVVYETIWTNQNDFVVAKASHFHHIHESKAMTEQIYYEDISEGMGIPSLLVHPDPVQLVKFAGASGDYHPIHFSNEAALARGLPGIIIYGKMRSALLCQLLTDWIGSQGRLVGISVQQRDIDRVDTDLICTGTVTGQRQNGDDYLVDCDIWIENEEKARTVVGTSVVALPSKSQNA